MAGVAGAGLLGLQQKRLVVPVELRADRLALREKRTERRDVDRLGFAAYLHDRGVHCCDPVKRRGRTHYAVTPDHSGFDHVALRQSDDERDDAARRTMNGINLTAVL